MLKWSYSPYGWRGAYRDELTMEEMHRHDVRVYRLRGNPKPRSRDDVAKLFPGLTMNGGFKALLYRETPFFKMAAR
jgi:hypothetical protein